MFKNFPKCSRIFQNILWCLRMIQNDPEDSRRFQNVTESFLRLACKYCLQFDWTQICLVEKSWHLHVLCFPWAAHSPVSLLQTLWPELTLTWTFAPLVPNNTLLFFKTRIKLPNCLSFTASFVTLIFNWKLLPFRVKFALFIINKRKMISKYFEIISLKSFYH